MSDKRGESECHRLGGTLRIGRCTLFALVVALVLLSTQTASSSLSPSQAATDPKTLPDDWLTYISHRLGIAIHYPASWQVYTDTMRGRYPGLDPILLTSFEMAFEPEGHGIVIPPGGAGILLAFEGNNRARGQTLGDYALANLSSPYYRLAAHNTDFRDSGTVEMVGEMGRVAIFGHGANVYSAFRFAGNDSSQTPVVDDVLAGLAPLQEEPILLPKGLSAAPGTKEFAPLSEAPPGLMYPWSGPAMKMPWDSSAAYRYTGGPHNWTMRWDCYLAPVDDACGLDFGMAEGTPILAVADGTVQWGYAPGSVGNYAIVDHGSGWSTRYLHLRQIDSSLVWNQTVTQGRVLGYSGTAGTGPHLHLEIRYNSTIPAAWHGTPIDGYVPRMYVYAADDSKGWNYQGTLTRGSESTSIITYCGAQTIKWTGSRGTIVAGDGQPVASTNQAHTGQPSPTPTATATPTPTATPVLAPDVSIQKTALVGELSSEQLITFTLTIANRGDGRASQVVITDVLPVELTSPSFASSLALTSTGPLDYVWDAQPLEAEMEGVITVTGRISAGLGSMLIFVNQATVWDPEDVTPGNNTDIVLISPIRAYLPLSLHSSTIGPPTPTPTATPATCTEGVMNGGFESDTAWEIPAPGAGIYPAGYSTSQAHTGTRSMRVGIVDPEDDVSSWSSARQLVTIPADSSSVTLSFWLFALTEEPPLTSGDLQSALLWEDLQLVRLLTEGDQFLDSLVRQRLHSPQWTRYEFDLTEFAGQSIKLYFGVINDGQSGVTAMYVDDVCLQMCAEP